MIKNEIFLLDLLKQWKKVCYDCKSYIVDNLRIRTWLLNEKTFFRRQSNNKRFKIAERLVIFELANWNSCWYNVNATDSHNLITQQILISLKISIFVHCYLFMYFTSFKITIYFHTFDFGSDPSLTAMTTTPTASSLLPNRMSSNWLKFPGDPKLSMTQSFFLEFPWLL